MKLSVYTMTSIRALREAVADILLPLDGESLTSPGLTKTQIQKLVQCVNALPVLLDEVESLRREQNDGIGLRMELKAEIAKLRADLKAADKREARRLRDLLETTDE